MTRELVILDEDKAYMRTRIAELQAEIQSLGPDFTKYLTNHPKPGTITRHLMRCEIVSRC